MKKFLSVLLALCLLVGAVPVLASAAEDDFTIEDGVLVKYNGPGGDVVIPKGVTSIGKSVFEDFEGLTSVVIPKGVTSIGESAFRRCKGLTSVVFPEGLTNIGERAFEGCEGLTGIVIPEGVTNIGSMAFFECFNLEKVSFPSSLKVIGGASFRRTVLTSVVIPDGVTTIESSAFSLSHTLTSVTIPNSVTSIGNYAFEMLAKLSSITLPEGLTTISKGLFYASEDLQSITIPASVTKIEEYAFYSGYDDNFPLKDIYYGGTEEQWKKIDINPTGNKRLSEAVVHYAQKPPKPSDPTVGGFTDVKASAYYADAVVWAVENDITNGIGGNKFNPDGDCNRDQIVTFLYRAKNKPEVTITNQFTDMPANEEFQKAISWAVEEGVTQGVGGGKFGPGQTCTRVQAVTFMWRAAGSPEPVSTATFSDMPSYSDFRKAISWAAENNITTGAGGNKFDPEATCSRGQIVTFLYRAKNL